MIQHELLRILRGMTTNAIVTLIAIGFAGPATALCVGPKEGGRWWNANPQGAPISLEVTLDECGDQVLNGEQTETSYGLMVFVKQSNGNLYQRPKVKARFTKSKDGKTWLHASVPTGGYVDQIRLLRNDVNGQERLYAYIKHESLDSKPSAESKYWFSRQMAVSRPDTTLEVAKGKSIANANPLVAAIRARSLSDRVSFSEAGGGEIANNLLIPELMWR